MILNYLMKRLELCLDDCKKSILNIIFITRVINVVVLYMYIFMFQLIEKCYANENFPKPNIEVIDKLYRSLPSEFLETKHFLQLLNESNQAIWPDSSASLYVYIEHIYNQLLQFKTSMKVKLCLYSFNLNPILNKLMVRK